MTQKMLMAKVIAENESASIFDVASAGNHYCTRGGARLWDLAKEYMICRRAKWAYFYRDKEYHFRDGFRNFFRERYQDGASIFIPIGTGYIRTATGGGFFIW